MSQFVTAIVGLVLIPLIRGKLGSEAFSIWFLLSTGLRYPMILESSFSLSTNRFVAFYRNDTELQNRFVSASFAVLSVLGVLTAAAAALLSFFIPDLFTAITQDYAFDAQITCILVGVTLAFKIIEASFSGTLMGYQYHTRTNSVIVIVNMFKAVLTIGLLIVWKSIIAVQLAFALSAAFSLMMSFIVAKKSIPSLKIDILKVDRNAVWELFRYTGHAAARSGSMIFMYSTVTLLTGKFGTKEHLDIFAVASVVSGFIRSLLAGMQNVFLPVVTSLQAKGQLEKMKAVVAKGTHISCILTCMTTILLFIYAGKFLDVLFDDIVPDMITILRVLIVSEVARGFFGIWLPSLVGMGHLRTLTVSAIVTSIGAIVLELILFKNSVYVPFAAAISLLAATWAYMGFWVPVYGLYKTHTNPIEYFKNSLLGPIAAAAVSIAVLKLLNYIIPINGFHWILMFIVSGIIVIIIFVILSMRSEAAELLIIFRRKFGSQTE